MKTFLIRIMLVCFSVAISVPHLNAQNDAKPNILLILADDLGYGDLQSFNAESLVPTPNLDKLAAGGTRLTNAYCPVSVCSPTRYALMTGRYPWRSWKKSGVMANYEPSMIDADILTLPEMLQNAGYRTAGFGKWHLGTTFPTLDGNKPVGYGKFRADDNGANLDLTKPVSDGPLDHGFQHWLGFSCASECWILEDNRIMGAIKHDLYTVEATPNADHIRHIPLEDYLPFITTHTLDYLKKQANERDGKPFFLYFAPYVPHIPLAVSTRFQGSTQAGLYGDYVHELDHYLGKIFNALDSLGLADNTLVLFASDNGSQFPASSNAMDMTKASNNSSARLEGDDAAAVHYPNAPLRGTKWTIYEGGVRTPFIARWPGKIPAGRVHDGLFALNDVLPSLAAAVGYKLPATEAEDGFNQLPLLTRGKKSARKEVVVQSSGNVLGIREGNWKYIGAGNYKPENPADPPGELYDLSTDIGETKNLYLEQPKKAAKMKAKLLKMVNDEVEN